MSRRRLHRRYGHAMRVPRWARGFEARELIGKRVQLHPGTDSWMMGDRYGEIVGFGAKDRVVKVKLDKSGKTLRMHLDRHVTEVF